MKTFFSLGTMYWLNPNYSSEEFAEDIRRLRENGFRMVRLLVGWEQVEESRGNYNFDYVDRFMDEAAKSDLKVMITPGLYPPYYLVRDMDREGKNDPGRYPSFERPEMWERTAAWIKAIVTRYQNNPALETWNIWNEPTLNTTLHRPMLEKFCQWLHQRYPDYKSLKAAWRGEYPALSLLCPASMEELTPDYLAEAFHLESRGRMTSIRFDLMRFYTELLKEECLRIAAEIRKYDKKHPTHTNIPGMNWNPAQSERDRFLLAETVDEISCSIHPANDYPPGAEVCDLDANFSMGAEETWSWCKGAKDAFIGELQIGTSDIHARHYTPLPQTVKRELWGAMATGLQGVIFWQWQAWRAGTFELGEFCLRGPSDCAPNKRSEEIRKFAEVYRRYEPQLTGLKRVRSKIAVFFSQDTGIFRSLAWRAHSHLSGVCHDHNFGILGVHKALTRAGYQIELLCEKEVLAGKLKDYALVYFPNVNVVRPEIADAIADFVRGGGSAWADGRFGFLDAHMYVRKSVPLHQLPEVFGAKETDYTAEKDFISFTTEEGLTVPGYYHRQILQPLGGTVSARYADGEAAVVDHRYGKGRTRLIGLSVARRLRDYEDESVRKYITDYAELCGIAPEIPENGLYCRHLESPERAFIVAQNRTDREIHASFDFPGETVELYSGKIYGAGHHDIAAAALDTLLFLVKK